ELYLRCLAKDPADRPTAASAAKLLAPFARGTGAELVPAESPVVRLATDAYRPAVSHAGRRRTADRRVLPAVFSLAALAAVFALVFGTAHAIMDGKATASRGSGVPAASPSTMPNAGVGASASPSTEMASPMPTMANVVMPSVSASMTMSQFAFPSASAPVMGTLIQVAFPAPGADPIGYLQALATQI